jgi:hypothetical protein
LGFKISWIGFKGLSKGAVLDHIGFRDTGRREEGPDDPFSLAELPTGWSILFANDFTFGAAEHLRPLSVGCEVVACQAHEGVMYSAAHQASQGHDVWSISHDSDIDRYDLTVSGQPPSFFNAVRSSLQAEQDAHGGKDAGVDYIFDIPVEVAFRLTGYRYDRWRFEWGEPDFTVIERTR